MRRIFERGESEVLGKSNRQNCAPLKQFASKVHSFDGLTYQELIRVRSFYCTPKHWRTRVIFHWSAMIQSVRKPEIRHLPEHAKRQILRQMRETNLGTFWFHSLKKAVSRENNWPWVFRCRRLYCKKLRLIFLRNKTAYTTHLFLQKSGAKWRTEYQSRSHVASISRSLDRNFTDNQ